MYIVQFQTKNDEQEHEIYFEGQASEMHARELVQALAGASNVGQINLIWRGSFFLPTRLGA